jgi:hypothetical protein
MEFSQSAALESVSGIHPDIVRLSELRRRLTEAAIPGRRRIRSRKGLLDLTAKHLLSVPVVKNRNAERKSQK